MERRELKTTKNINGSNGSLSHGIKSYLPAHKSVCF